MAVFTGACRQRISQISDTHSSGADGHVSGTVDYDVFGKPVTETGVFAGASGGSGGISALVFAYAGKPYDSVTGLSDYGFRDYAPTLAHFTTVDPIRDGSNWYAYCNSDPVNYVDMWGLVCIRNSDAQAAADKIAATGNNKGTLGELSKDPTSGINTQEMAKKISQNIDKFCDDDKTKAWFSVLPEDIRTDKIKEVLDSLYLVTGIDVATTASNMDSLLKGSTVKDDMIAGITNGDAFSAAGYLMFFSDPNDISTVIHETIHALQSFVSGNAGKYLTEYTNEAERLKANGDDWYYGNYFEKSAYAFGPWNWQGNRGNYVQ